MVITPGRESPPLYAVDPALEFQGYMAEEVEYHLELLFEAVLVDG
jgi:hypothetical protein